MFVVVVFVFVSLSLSISLLFFDTSVFLQDCCRVDTVLLAECHADEPWYLTKLATHVDGIQPSKKASCHAFVLPIF